MAIFRRMVSPSYINLLAYQAEAERAPLISPPDMNSSFRNKGNSLDISSVSNNGLNLSHASYAPPPKKTHTVESPPYARLRPFTFHMGDPMSVKGSSPHSKSQGLNSSFQSGYASTKPYDLWKKMVSTTTTRCPLLFRYFPQTVVLVRSHCTNTLLWSKLSL
ncbi:hypothetical protein COOONC_13019 [Cooperia oncophora]